ncbi:MAG: hypothetical protein ACKO38_14245 [Planctomycetota bacterium]
MAVDAVRERTLRLAHALEQAEIPYAVVGGNAVAAWVARVDIEAVRNTKDVDVLVRRADLQRIVNAAHGAGFVYQNIHGVDTFLDGPDGSVRSAVHLLFAQEKVRPDSVILTPDVTDSEEGPEFRIASLDALVSMKLTAFRLKDKVHLLDLMEVGLIDANWRNRLPPELARRLTELMETREQEN